MSLHAMGGLKAHQAYTASRPLQPVGLRTPACLDSLAVNQGNWLLLFRAEDRPADGLKSLGSGVQVYSGQDSL